MSSENKGGVQEGAWLGRGGKRERVFFAHSDPHGAALFNG